MVYGDAPNQLPLGMPTVCFRGGRLTGPTHAGAELHGFLADLLRACAEGRPYQLFGHKAKQVRDNLHARDFVAAFWHYVAARKLDWRCKEEERIGDHTWWAADLAKFLVPDSGSSIERDVTAIIEESDGARHKRV